LCFFALRNASKGRPSRRRYRAAAATRTEIVDEAAAELLRWSLPLWWSSLLGQRTIDQESGLERTGEEGKYLFTLSGRDFPTPLVKIRVVKMVKKGPARSDFFVPLHSAAED
jgi:hypothetical protein